MSILALIPLVSALAYVPLVAVVLSHPRPRERRAFSLYLVLAGFWSLLSFLIRLDIPLLQDHTLDLNKLLIICLLCVVLSYYYFARVFVGKGPGLGVYLGSVFILGMALLAALGFVPVKSFSSGGLLYVEFGASLYLLTLFSLTMIGASSFILIKHMRESTHRLSRTRVVYLLIGLAVVALTGLTNMSEVLSRYPIDHVGNLLNAMIISYAILKYQLLEIRIVLQRGLPYSILTAGLTALYLLLLYTLQGVFHGFSGPPGLIFAAILAMFMAAGFAPLRTLIQDRVDRLFFRSSYELRRMLSSFRSNLVYPVDLHHLGEDTLAILVNGLGAQWASLLFPDPITGNFHVRFVAPQGSQNSVTGPVLDCDGPVIRLLERDAQVLQMELFETMPEAKGLWLEERDALRDYAVELLCPLVSHGRIVGILALGEKRRGVEYTPEELEVLLNVASWTALALDNAEALDNLRRQQKRAERLLAQVMQGQEQEREWVALELHDSVAQELVRTSYQVQICRALLAQDKGFDPRAELAAVSNAVDDTLKELRRVLSGLRPPALDELGLVHALRQLTRKSEQVNVACQFETTGAPIRLDPTVEISVYRIVQEALSNVRRHAHASNVKVELLFQEKQLTIEVIDDGKGFDGLETLENSASAGKMGLNGINQRAEWLGGTLIVKSRHGIGTSLIVRIPLSLQVDAGVKHTL